MSTKLIRHNRPVSGALHPLVYKAIAGLVLWYVLSVWILFSSSGYTELLFAMVTVLFFMAVAIPFALWLVWRQDRESDMPRGEGNSFRDWAHGEFETWQGRLNGANAAIEILLPIMAVAFGITAFGIVLRLTAGAVPL
jgi:hypothetical protein